MHDRTNEILVRSFMEAFSSGNVERVLEMLSDSATWWTAGSFALSGTRDKKQFAESFVGIGEHFEGPLRLMPKAFTVDGERVAVEAESYGEFKNGRIYNNHYHFLFEIRDGKIERVREYLDTMHANDVLCGELKE